MAKKQEAKRILKNLIPIFLLILGISLLNAPTILNETEYLDYSSDEVTTAIEWVEERSTTDIDRIFRTATYIRSNIEYEVTGGLCIGQSASDVINAGVGDCVSMSKLASAMLSGMNIPTKITEGCVFDIDEAREFIIPENRQVKILSDIDSREAGPHNGQLHSWIEAYDGDKWWVMETTAGIIFQKEFVDELGYDTFGYVSPSDPYDLCLINDNDYVNYCLEY